MSRKIKQTCFAWEEGYSKVSMFKISKIPQATRPLTFQTKGILQHYFLKSCCSTLKNERENNTQRKTQCQQTFILARLKSALQLRFGTDRHEAQCRKNFSMVSPFVLWDDKRMKIFHLLLKRAKQLVNKRYK